MLSFFNVTIHFRLFLFVFISFIVCTIVGTLSHESGHWLVARWYGSTSTRIAYAYTTVDGLSIYKTVEEIYKRNKEAIKDKKEFPEKAKYQSTLKEAHFASFMVTLGGMIQTMLTGSIAFVILIFFGNRFRTDDGITLMGWTWIFLSLFWLRQPANCSVLFVRWYIMGDWGFSDEVWIANYLNIPPYSIALITGLLGLGVLAWITFCYLPTKLRFTFLLAGGTGGIAGYFFWLEWIGKYILP